MRIEVEKVILDYLCSECQIEAQQDLTDIVEIGTLICPDCEDDMELADFVTIKN